MSKLSCFGLNGRFLFLFFFHFSTAISNDVARFFKAVAYKFRLFSVLLVIVWKYSCQLSLSVLKLPHLSLLQFGRVCHFLDKLS